MRILLTGGSGDLGQALVPLLEGCGHIPVIFDILTPGVGVHDFINGSLLEPNQLRRALESIDLVVHIAAWHGIHEAQGLKTPQEFWGLNVNGTHNLLQACVDAQITRMIHISSSSVMKLSGYYGFTKRLAEAAVNHFNQDHQLHTVTLRPRAFIPPWNRHVYGDFLEWVRRFWPGAVHIDDVAQAVMLSIEFLSRGGNQDNPILVIDREPDYPQGELVNWDVDGPGTSFQKHYAAYREVVSQFELDTSVKPVNLNIQEAQEVLGYQPHYGLRDLLVALARLP